MDLGKKYCIICDRENIESIQKLLFSWGYKWNGQSSLNINCILPCDTFSNKKIYLSNYGNGINNWILKCSFVHDTYFEVSDDVNVYSDLALLRKEKLIKINATR